MYMVDSDVCEIKLNVWEPFSTTSQQTDGDYSSPQVSPIISIDVVFGDTKYLVNHMPKTIF